MLKLIDAARTYDTETRVCSNYSKGVNVKRTTLVVLISILLTNFALVNANAGSMCNNGTMSSNSGRGTCSYNGGVNKNFPSYSDPGSSSYNRNNGYGSQKSRRW